ncbi:MAG: SpoIIE family protein phosphatase [Acidimicrobiales bacterium]
MSGPTDAESADPPAREVPARIQTILDCLPRGIVIWDLHGKVLAWNHYAEVLYGWNVDEILGRHIGDLLFLPADLDAAYEIALGVEAGRPWSGDITIVRADGDTVRIFTVLAPLRDDDGNIVGSVGMSDDVTDQRIVEERAAELTNHLLMALAGGELGTWRWELASGRVVWDSTMERLCGLEPGTFGGTYEAWLESVHPDDRERTVAVVDDAVSEVTSYQVEHRVVWPDGSVRWLQGRAMVTLAPDGSVSGTIGCSGDVTGRKLAELEIARRVQEAERLVEEGRLQRRRLEFLSAINAAALAASSHRELMAEVTATAVPLLGDWCSLHFIDGQTAAAAASPEIVVAHSDPARIEWIHSLLVKHPYDPEAPVGAAAAVRTGATQFIADFGPLREAIIEGAVRARPSEARRILDELQLTSLIAVPLVTKRGVVGAMQFVSAESGRLYTDEDVALAETAAGRVAEALESTWLRDQQRNVASVLQAALLPSTVPAVDGLSVAVRYWAAGAVSDVGGDFYDVFPLPDRDDAAAPGDGAAESPRRWAVVIGDVCGTGPEAAAVTALARHTIRAAARHGASPVEVLEWLNEAMLDGDRDRFCTVLYSTLERVDAGRWRFTSVAGGHPLPWLVRPGEHAAPLGRPGTLLGVMPRLRLHAQETELVEGDTVVLNTDGITDVPSPYGLDEAAMGDMVTAAAGAGGHAERVAERLGEAVQRILPLPDRDDDIALVVLRVLGPDDERSGPPVAEALGERSFAPAPASVSAAREFVVSTVGDPSLADALRLAVSELATNAVIHAGTEFRVTISRSGPTVRVDVVDRSDRLPTRRDRGPEATGGRGIGIVEQLSTRWGVTPGMPGAPDAPGKAVWFELGR